MEPGVYVARGQTIRVYEVEWPFVIYSKGLGDRAVGLCSALQKDLRGYVRRKK